MLPSFACHGEPPATLYQFSPPGRRQGVPVLSGRGLEMPMATSFSVAPTGVPVVVLGRLPEKRAHPAGTP